MALPFIAPLPLPGVSPFGAGRAILGTRQVLHQQPWLPRRLLELRLPHGFLGNVLRLTGRVVTIFEHFLRPRLA